MKFGTFYRVRRGGACRSRSPSVHFDREQRPTGYAAEQGGLDTRGVLRLKIRVSRAHAAIAVVPTIFVAVS
jgi:hypothetical protein